MWSDLIYIIIINFWPGKNNKKQRYQTFALACCNWFIILGFWKLFVGVHSYENVQHA